MKKILYCNYKILGKQKLIIESIKGVVTPGSLLNLKIIELKDPNFSPKYNLIGDIRDTTFDVVTSQIDAFVNFIVDNKDSFEINKTAILLSTVNQQIYINILKSHQEKFPHSLKICTSIEDALAWVNCEDEADLILDEFKDLKKNLTIEWVSDSEF